MALAQNDVNPAHLRAELGLLDLRTGRRRALEALPAARVGRAVAFTPGRLARRRRVVRRGAARLGRRLRARSSRRTAARPRASAGRRARRPHGAWPAWGTGASRRGTSPATQRLGRTFRWTAVPGGCHGAPCFVVNPQGTLMATDQADGKVALVDLQTLRRDRHAAGPGRSARERARVLPRRPAAGHGRRSTGTSRSGTSGRAPCVRTLRFPTRCGGSRSAPTAGCSPCRPRPARPRTHASRCWTRARGRSGTRAAVRYGHGGLEFSPDGRSLAALGCCEPGSTIAVWDARSGKQRFSPASPATPPRSPSPPTAGSGPEPGTGSSCAGTSATASRSGHRSRSPPPRSTRSRSRPTAACSWPARSTGRRRCGTSGPAGAWASRSRRVRAGSRRPTSRPTATSSSTYFGGGAIWPTDPRAWQRYACQVAGRDLTRGGVERRPARSGLPARLLALGDTPVSRPDSARSPAAWQHPDRPCVHIVQIPGRSGRSGRDMDGSDTWVTRLRAWSGMTGWRFESSSAHLQSPASGGFAALRRDGAGVGCPPCRPTPGRPRSTGGRGTTRSPSCPPRTGPRCWSPMSSSGWARAYLVGKHDESVAVWERAHQALLGRGERRRGGRVRRLDRLRPHQRGRNGTRRLFGFRRSARLHPDGLRRLSVPTLVIWGDHYRWDPSAWRARSPGCCRRRSSRSSPEGTCPASATRSERPPCYPEFVRPLSRWSWRIASPFASATASTTVLRDARGDQRPAHPKDHRSWRNASSMTDM